MTAMEGAMASGATVETVEVTSEPAMPEAARPGLDPRRHAWRPDLADADLWDKVEAENYVEGQVRVVTWPSLPIRRRPVATAGFETEALFGETVKVFEDKDGWAWLQLAADRYVGYAPSIALGLPAHAATHRVQALGTFVYPTPDIKTPPMATLSLGARVTAGLHDARFSALATGGFIVSRHLADLSRPARDFVAVAERFLGTPYLWGGRSRLGLDCSALVQLSLDAAGIAAPRDSDMQQAELGATVLVPQDLEGLRRGDLVFWPGHVGIMSDAVMLVHANAHHMAVAIEPLVTAAARIGRSGSQIATVRRLAALGAEGGIDHTRLDEP